MRFIRQLEEIVGIIHLQRRNAIPFQSHHVAARCERYTNNNSRRQSQLAQKSLNRTTDILQIQQEGIVTEQ
jgi:hypothetical protein